MYTAPACSCLTQLRVVASCGSRPGTLTLPHAWQQSVSRHGAAHYGGMLWVDGGGLWLAAAANSITVKQDYCHQHLWSSGYDVSLTR